MSQSRRDRRVEPRRTPPKRLRRLSIESLEDRAVPATFLVSSAADSGANTLRWAIEQARLSPGADEIGFAPALEGQTIVLTTNSENLAFGPTALPIVGDDVTIDGQDAPLLSISGDDARRIFAVGSGASLTLRNVTLTGGLAQGGRGGDTVAFNAAGGGGAGLGGAVYVYMGTLNIENSTFHANSAVGGRGGNISLVTVPGVEAATGGGSAGGNGGDYTGSGVQFLGGAGIGGSAPSSADVGAGQGGLNEFGLSSSDDGGGTSGNSGGPADSATSLSSGGFGGGGGGGNASSGGQGGGNGGFGAGGGGGTYGSGGGNGGFGGGGGGAYYRFDNPATGLGGFGGGNADASTNATGPGGGGAGMGGAVFNNGGTVNIANSTFVGNSAVGGAAGVGWGSGGHAGQGLGGAIFNYNGTTSILNSTLTDNPADDGDIYNLGDGASLQALVTLSNTILATSGSGTVFYSDSINGGNDVTTGVANLIIGTTVNLSAASIPGTFTDPGLGALADNGGPTMTRLPDASSPALGAGNVLVASSLTTDQRLMARVTGGSIDVGSVQLDQSAPPEITSASSVTFAIGSSRSFTVVATGAPTPTLSITGGSLPDGLTFTPNADGTATISGTATGTVTGDFVITISAANGVSPDAVQTFTLTLVAALALDTSALAQGAVASPYAGSVAASGGSGSGYAYAAAGLPPGLVIDAITGAVSGVPTDDAGSPYPVVITVTDSDGNSADFDYSFVVNPAIGLQPASLPTTAALSPYSVQVEATGGSGTFTYALEPSVEHPFPTGLTFTAEGLLSGAVAAPGLYQVMIRATDDQGASQVFAYLLNVNPAIVLAGQAPPPATAGSAYSQQLEASGGSGSGYTFSAEGLPEGLTIDASTGLISGVPATDVGSPFDVVVTITDGDGSTGVQTISLVVQPALAISPAELPTSVVGGAYSQQIEASGGSGSGYTFSAEGLPEGFTISETGLITGTASTAVGSPFTVLITVTAGDGATAVLTRTLVVERSTVVASLAASPAPGTFGAPFVLTFDATSNGPASSPIGGTATLYDGETVLAVVPVIDGRAVYMTDALAPGPHSFRAVYSGDAAHAPAASPTIGASILITPDAGFSSSASTAEYGSPVTFRLAIAPEGAFVPTGLATFYDGDTLLGTVPIGPNGVAEYTTSTLGVGSHSIRAVYSGDSNFASYSSPSLGLAVGRAQATGGTVATSATQVFNGQVVELFASFSAPNAGAPMSGTVAFYVDDVLVGTAAIHGPSTGLASLTAVDSVSGFASLAGVRLPVGRHVVRAAYSGDALYAPAVSETPVEVVVAPAGTATSLTAAVAPGGSTVLTAAVVATTPDAPPLDGAVAFYDGDVLLGVVPLVDGSAALDVGVLAAGAHSFRAVYNGVGGGASSSVGVLVIDAGGPRVVGLGRYGIHANPTTIVLTFSSALDPASAQDPANYRISLGRGRFIPISLAVYDAEAGTVTLHPSQSLSLYRSYTLVVNGHGPGGVRGASGVLLDGAGGPGTDFVTTITWRSLATSTAPAVTYVDGSPAYASTTGLVARSRAVLAARLGRLRPIANPMGRLRHRPR